MTDTAAYIEADTFASHAAEEHASRMIVAHTPIRTVTIPARAEHEGIYSRAVRLVWKCPVCGGERGEVHEALSYDGSRRLHVSGWTNACGHIDKYADVREEAGANGLNGEAVQHPAALPLTTPVRLTNGVFGVISGHEGGRYRVTWFARHCWKVRHVWLERTQFEVVSA